jgi:hypothetical protein
LGTALSASAAIELFDLGERRLALLGSSLIQALHDGGYLPRAEEILAELIAAGGHEASMLIVSYISETRHHGGGGHSGWWRLLFQFVHDPTVRGPELLVDCMRGVGEFLLARYPEIRNSFRELVLSSRNEHFRSALHSALNDAEPDIRHGAAMVLITSDPQTEALALEIVVRFMSHRSCGSWFEWERYCLTMKFGSSVLSHLESQLPLISGPSRAFALAILFQNEAELDDAQFQEFIVGALTVFYGAPIEGMVFHSPRIQKALLEIVDNGSEEPSRKAAGLLIDQARANLDQEHYVRCRVLTLNGDEWRNPDFAVELERMRTYPEYAALVVEEARRQLQRGFPRPLIDQIYASDQDPNLWVDILWREICIQTRGSGAGSRGQWILEFLLKQPDSRQAIGIAAKRLLQDKRISKGFNTDEPISWLALLAHEGGQLSKEELGKIVDSIDPVDKCAYVPLVTRLGRAPSNDRPRPRYRSPVFQLGDAHHFSPETATFQRFMEFARPGGEFHPDFCSMIEQSLYNNPFSEEQLQALADTGQHGTLVAVSLGFAYGRLPKPEWAIAALGVKPLQDMQNQPCQRIIVARWESILFASKADPAWRASYLKKLEEALSTSAGNISQIGSEMLAIESSLSVEHLNILLRHLVHEYYDDDNLCAALSKLLADAKNHDLLKQAAETVNAAIAELDLQPWNPDEARPKDAGAFLMFPLLRWRISENSETVSRRVFLRGLKMALLPPRRADVYVGSLPSRFIGIGDVSPLIQKASKAILEDAIQYGLTLDDTELRALCRLFILTDVNQKRATDETYT